ncbi:MAG: hypothetical protein ACI4F4_00790 [Lachnospiraceae bacterium]
MTFADYVKHYLSFPEICIFIGISFGIVVLIHIILMLVAGKTAQHFKTENRKHGFIKLFGRMTEEYYELMFSSTSILLFVGIYFLISFHYFPVSDQIWQFWIKYEDFILLGFIVFSIMINNIVDHYIVPLKKLDKDTKSILRMTGMLYMLIIFAYIKFIDQNNNYNMILGYFLTLVIGRFVYFDASFQELSELKKRLSEIIPSLFLVLLSTALLSLYGFKTEYLLRSNGVVVSLFLAHFFCIIEICVLSRTKMFEKISEKIFFKDEGK